MKKTTKKVIISSIVAAILVFAVLFCWNHFGASRTSAGSKTITVEVTHGNGSVRHLELHTNDEYLWDAMAEGHYIDGKDSQYGKWVTTVDGETADEANGQYWLFTRNGAWVSTSCDATPIADGESYEFFLDTD